MSDPITDEEFDLVRAAPIEDRYEYAVRRIAHVRSLWSLSTDDGWVLYGDDDGRELIPIWPDARFAALCALDEFADATPRQITLDDWVEQWTPALVKHERVVAVFSDAEGNAIVMEPGDFEDDLLFDYASFDSEEGDDDEEWEVELED